PRRSGGFVAVTSLTATTPEQTASAGEALGRTLGPGDVVALYGELGAGKTCFVQGLVRGLGGPPQAASPPGSRGGGRPASSGGWSAVSASPRRRRAPPSCSSTSTADACRSITSTPTAPAGWRSWWIWGCWIWSVGG